LRQRDGPLPRCTAMLRCASRGLQRSAGVRVCAHANAPPPALSREEAHHAHLRRARAAQRWLESIHALRGFTAPARRHTPSVHGRAPTCQPRPPTSSRRCVCAHANAPPPALSLSGGGAPRALAARALGAALVGVSLYLMEAHCASEITLSLGARPCSNMSGAASKEQPPFECTRTRTHHRTFSLGRRRTMHACGVRAPRRAGWSRFMPYGYPLRQRDGPLPRCMAMLRCASRGLQRVAGVRVCAHANAPPHALSREKAHHAHLRRARAAPRWLESIHALWRFTAPARRHNPSVHGRFPTCQPRPLTSSRRCVCAHANAPPRALSREEAQHVRLRRARAAPRWLRSVHVP